MNNSDVTVTEIGDRIEGGVGGALFCYTDNIQCCNNTENSGRWFKAGESDVGNDGDLYVTKGPNVVRLHRRNNSSPSAGVYCCEVPDFQSRMIITCVNIGGLIFVNSKSLFLMFIRMYLFAYSTPN